MGQLDHLRGDSYMSATLLNIFSECEELLAEGANGRDLFSMRYAHHHRRDSASIHVHSPHRINALSVRVRAYIYECA